MTSPQRLITGLASASGGEGEEDEPVADPGGDSDPGANEGFEPPEDRLLGRSGPTGLGRIGSAIDDQAALDAIAAPLHRALDQRLPDGLRTVLQGRWLGHPLHPVLTDVPIGSWTSAWLLDLFGGRRAEGSADALVAVGVAAAVPTLWAGWADWIELPERRRRSGVVHAAANGLATGLYASSLVARVRGNRKLGVRLAHAGAGAATLGGFLGGHLAFADPHW